MSTKRMKMYGQICVLASCVILCCLVQPTASSCSLSMPTTQDKCTSGGIVLALNSEYIDFNKCKRWTCGKDGSLSICGYGINAGLMMALPGCKYIEGKRCAPKLVDENDHDAECQPQSLEGPVPLSMTGKK